MPLTGYMKIPDIDGESKFAGPRGRDRHSRDRMGHFAQGQARAAPGADGRRDGRWSGRLVVHKFYDAASPYIALAAMQGKSFDEIVISIRKDSGEAHLDYLSDHPDQLHAQGTMTCSMTARTIR